MIPGVLQGNGMPLAVLTQVCRRRLEAATEKLSTLPLEIWTRVTEHISPKEWARTCGLVCCDFNAMTWSRTYIPPSRYYTCLDLLTV